VDHRAAEGFAFEASRISNLPVIVLARHGAAQAVLQPKSKYFR
jgi:hypothetical protein